jgi:hypothetical protein
LGLFTRLGDRRVPVMWYNRTFSFGDITRLERILKLTGGVLMEVAVKGAICDELKMLFFAGHGFPCR